MYKGLKKKSLLHRFYCFFKRKNLIEKQLTFVNVKLRHWHVRWQLIEQPMNCKQYIISVYGQLLLITPSSWPPCPQLAYTYSRFHYVTKYNIPRDDQIHGDYTDSHCTTLASIISCHYYCICLHNARGLICSCASSALLSLKHRTLN